MADIGTTVGMIQAFNSSVKSAISGLEANKMDAPTTAGTSGQVLTSDGNGGQVWATPTGEGVVIDSTLSVSGQAADAAAVGNVRSFLYNVVTKDASLYDANAFAWEHGGIDNATGLNNNDGSTSRSRTPDYYETKYFEKITNNTNERVYIIYYNSSKAFLGFQKIDKNTTGLFNYSDGKKYFRVDVRSGFDALPNVLTYKITNLELKNNIHEERYAHIYTGGYRLWYIEESNPTSTVYFSVTDSGSVMVRYGKDGASVTSKTLTMAQLAEELGTTTTTSPNGMSNCIALPTSKAFVFDMSAEQFKFVDRYSVTNDQILLLAQASGYITYVSNMILRSMIKNATAGGVDIPLYFKTNVDGAIEKYKGNAEVVGNHGDSFVFITDTHWGSNQKHSPDLIRYIVENSNVRNVICGGDILESGTKADELAKGYAFVKAFSEIPGGIKCVTGNHDYNRNQHVQDPTYWLTPEQGYSMFGAKSEMEIQDVYNAMEGGYEELTYYMDVPGTKTRYLFLSIAYGVVTDRAKNWVIGQLTDNPELNFVIFSHYLYGTSDFTENVKTLFAAVKDFTNLKAWVYGHTHYDRVDYLSTGIPLVCVDTDSSKLNATDNPYTYTAGTITEQAFDVMTVDYTDKNVYCSRVGRGKSRKVNGGVNSVSASGTTTLTTDITSAVWSSSDSSVATVNNGTVTGVSAGSAVIKAAGTSDEEYWYVVVS